MLRIAICDDEIKDIKIIKELTVNLLDALQLTYEIEEFLDGSLLLDSVISFDIILLDIEMEKMNGIEVARKLRVYNRDSKIIFITNSPKYMRTGYSVKADGYFLKPIDKIEFNYELTNILKEDMIDSKFILDKRISPYKIYINAILYIEYRDRKTIIHFKDHEIATPLTLKEWESLLGNYYFSQCHKAYIVNLRMIRKLNSDSIILSNDEELILSRKYKIEFKADYFNSIGERF